VSALHPGFEGDAQKTGVEVDIRPLGIGPGGRTGVIRRVGFDHDAIYPAEAIDQEMVGSFGADELQQFLADSLQSGGLLRLKCNYVAFGGVEHDAGRLRAQRPCHCRALSDQTVRARHIRNRERVLDAQAVAVEIVCLVLLHGPYFGGCDGGLGDQVDWLWDR